MFVVNEIINANDSKYNVAPGDEDQKTLGCLCCEQGPITLSTHLNRSCFCPGDDILVTAKLKNNTDRDMDELEAKLMQEISFKAELKGGDSTDHRYELNEVAELESKKIKGGDDLEWKGKAMMVPPLPPTMDSKFIDIKYYVRIHLDIPMAIDMNFKLPITIGTVPFLGSYHEPSASGKTFKPKCPDSIGPADVEILGVPSMIPFMYSQVLKDKPKKMNKKEDQEYEDDTYIPLYTFAAPTKMPEPKTDVHVGDDSGSKASIRSGGSGNEMPPIH